MTTTHDEPGPTTAVPHDLLTRMFSRLVMARTLETRMARHVREEGFAGWWHPGLGEEGAGIGATAAMRPTDYLYYQGRGCAWAIGKGMGPGPIWGDLLGRTTGATGGKGGGVPHWADPALGIMGEGATLGSVYPLAAGTALASQIRGSDEVTLAHFGDGTASRGTFHETLLQAAVWKLPLIYFCTNNGLAVSTRFEDQSPTPHVADRACAYGIPGVVVDGQDAVAVYDATSEAIARARAGDGPTLIEATTVRVGGHWEGDVQQYRDLAQRDAAYRDPVEVLRVRLEDDEASELERAAAEEVEASYRQTLDAPKPSGDIIFKDVFA